MLAAELSALRMRSAIHDKTVESTDNQKLLINSRVFLDQSRTFAPDISNELVIVSIRAGSGTPFITKTIYPYEHVSTQQLSVPKTTVRRVCVSIPWSRLPIPAETARRMDAATAGSLVAGCDDQ